jgi:hypothetical protein
VRHSLFLPRRFGIKHVEAANDLRIRVGQQRELNLVPLREILQDRRSVVANCSEFDPLVFKSLLGVLQLHELRFAERSPIGRPEKEQHRSVWPSQCVVCLFMAKLIASRKGRRFIFHLSVPSSLSGVSALPSMSAELIR